METDLKQKIDKIKNELCEIAIFQSSSIRGISIYIYLEDKKFFNIKINVKERKERKRILNNFVNFIKELEKNVIRYLKEGFSGKLRKEKLNFGLSTTIIYYVNDEKIIYKEETNKNIFGGVYDYKTFIFKKDAYKIFEYLSNLVKNETNS